MTRSPTAGARTQPGTATAPLTAGAGPTLSGALTRVSAGADGTANAGQLTVELNADRTEISVWLVNFDSLSCGERQFTNVKVEQRSNPVPIEGGRFGMAFAEGGRIEGEIPASGEARATVTVKFGGGTLGPVCDYGTWQWSARIP